MQSQLLPCVTADPADGAAAGASPLAPCPATVRHATAGASLIASSPCRHPLGAACRSLTQPKEARGGSVVDVLHAEEGSAQQGAVVVLAELSRHHHQHRLPYTRE
jgi:hypothetical protein